MVEELNLENLMGVLKKRRALPIDGFAGDPEIVEAVREFERLNNAPLPAVSLASAKTDDFDRLSLLDVLTELYNYRALLKELKAELSRAKRYKHPVSFCMITIDEIESIIQDYGTLTGDAVLKVVANVLRSMVREVDIVARYSERHFALVLPQTNTAGAALVAERIRQRVGNQAIMHNWQSFSVTCSVGVATFPQHALEYDLLIARAAEALEHSIERGGDRVLSV